MTRRALGAISGWGKSWTAQALWERYVTDFGASLLLDYKDEYQGLVEAGYASRLLVGPAEVGWSIQDWRRVIEANPHTVMVRHRLSNPEWRKVAAKIVAASRRLANEDVFDDGVLVGLDECHILAPQRGTVPEPITYLATTGRGEGAASLWIFQRSAKVEEDIISQADETMYGAFRRENDRDQIEIEYAQEVHKPNAGRVPGLHEDVHAPDSGPVSLRRFKENGSLVGSEWIYSDADGRLERRDTRNLKMESTHYGDEAEELNDPEF